MRVIIVGVGGVGAMAAWRLARAGHKVTALERFQIDHDRGSSYGDSRIVRRVYGDSLYTSLMEHAYRLWEELIRETGEQDLFVQAGGIFFGPAEHPEIHAAEAALAASGVPYERLNAAECARRFPAVRLDSEEVALHEPSMGYARASRAVRAAAMLARQSGAEIREEVIVVGVESISDGVRVRLINNEVLEADAVLLAPGPWAGELLASCGVRLPLTVTRQPYIHLLPDQDETAFLPPAFPVWIDAGANVYGFPRLGDVPGVKIGIHDFGAPSSPESVDRCVSEADRHAARAYAARRFRGLSSNVCYEKVCLYTVTPDNDFIIDTVPGLSRVIAISACSGHGFKFTPLLGQIAADLLAGHGTPYNLDRFRISRFAGTIGT